MNDSGNDGNVIGTCCVRKFTPVDGDIGAELSVNGKTDENTSGGSEEDDDGAEIELVPSTAELDCAVIIVDTGCCCSSAVTPFLNGLVEIGDGTEGAAGVVIFGVVIDGGLAAFTLAGENLIHGVVTIGDS